jgi:hypothetical protein
MGSWTRASVGCEVDLVTPGLRAGHSLDLNQSASFRVVIHEWIDFDKAAFIEQILAAKSST